MKKILYTEGGLEKAMKNAFKNTTKTVAGFKSIDLFDIIGKPQVKKYTKEEEKEFYKKHGYAHWEF